MNIAMVISTPLPPEEGIGNYSYRLSNNLSARGHEVVLITRGGYSVEEQNHKDIKIIKAPYVPLYPFHVDIHGLAVRRIISRLETPPDLIHLHSPLTPDISLNIPTVLTIHSTFIEDTMALDSRHPVRLAEKFVAKFSSKRILGAQIESAEKVTTVSKPVKEYITKNYAPPGPISVMGNGVDIQLFRPMGEENAENYVLYVGRLSRRKGVEDLVESFYHLDLDLDLKLVGDGPLRQRMEKEVASSNFSDKIHFEGQIDDQSRLVELYQHSMLFVLPSHFEGLPTVLLEAMACGKPVIGTRIHGCEEVIDNGVNGLLVPPSNPAKLSEKIRFLFEHPQIRSELGREARKTVQNRFAWQSVTDNFEHAFEEVLANQ